MASERCFFISLSHICRLSPVCSQGSSLLSVSYEEAVGVLQHQLYLYFHSSSACIRRAGVPPSRIWAARSTAVCGCSQAQDVLHKRGAPHPSRVGGGQKPLGRIQTPHAGGVAS